MKIIHSAWTLPMRKKRWNLNDLYEKNLWLYGYSLDYAQSIGLELELYTDTQGARIFDCLPYSKIHTTLDLLDTMNVSERFWAAGKIMALQHAEIGTLHIDGDVFLKNASIVNDLDFNGFDAICQMKERYSLFLEHYHDMLPHFQSVIGDTIDGFDFTLRQSVNAGILGFNNQELKDKFTDGFFQMVEKCSNSQRFMSLLKYDTAKKKEPNILMEQYYLTGLIHKYNYRMKYLLDLRSDNYQDDIQDMNNQANELGFAHAWGSSKYLLIEQIQAILKERNPDLFQAITDKVAAINNI